MTAREDLYALLEGKCGDIGHTPDQHIDAYRAEVLREAADFVRDAHFQDRLSVQEIGAALRHMASAP